MLVYILIGLGFLVAAFAIYVSTRPGEFRYERSGIIEAPPETIYPYISDLKKGGLWSPYEKKDPAMKKMYFGADGQVGSAMEWDGNKDAGAGRIEIVGLVPNRSAHLKLTMLKPIHAVNDVQYKLVPEGAGTRFFWIMSGQFGFLGKLMNVMIDCEKMVAGDFSVGINNLKTLIEAKK